MVLKDTRTSTTLEVLGFGGSLSASSTSLILENIVLDINHRFGIMKNCIANALGSVHNERKEER